MLLDDEDRLQSISSYQILGTSHEDAYDELAELVARTLKVPYVSMAFFGVGRVWMKASYGFPLRQTTADFSAGIAAFEATDIAVCPDVLDVRNHPWHELLELYPEVGAYAACRIPCRDGFALGSLVIATAGPHTFSEDDLLTLRLFAKQVRAHVELRRGDHRQHLVTSSSRALRLDDPHRLRDALENEEFVLHYQPLVSLERKQMYGVEALLRWQHPEWGLVSPDCFLPMLESSSLMSPVGRWVRERAVTDMGQIRQEFGIDLAVAVNISGREFERPGLALSVADLVTRTGIDPTSLTLELTESARLENTQLARSELRAVRDLGAHLVIDDYGTGYAGMQMLLDAPVTGIKVDRSFTARLHEPRAQRILSNMLEFCDANELGTLLEGIETEAQRELALALGFEWAQGYLFSAPLALSSVRQLLATMPIRAGTGRLSY